MGANEKQAWDAYRKSELHRIQPVLETLGFVLDDAQVHTGGERYLMMSARDVGGGGLKLVLVGKRVSDGKKVVIKVSREPEGILEIERERESRQLLSTLPFAVWTFHIPKELFFGRRGEYLLFVTEYIEQAVPLFARTLDEQFFMSLKAFETQEGAHATTSGHSSGVRESFGIMGAKDYLESLDAFSAQAWAHDPQNFELAQTLARTREFMQEHKTTIARYCGFLTHADFVPNNLRVEGHTLYLLDYASLHFGNKYESWARYLNYMVHHNPALEHALMDYVRENRGAEEYLSLRLMRVYKLTFLLQFWTNSIAHTAGDMHELVRARITFWTKVLNCILGDVPVPVGDIEHILKEEARLRTDEEKARQRELIGTRVGGF